MIHILIPVWYCITNSKPENNHSNDIIKYKAWMYIYSTKNACTPLLLHVQEQNYGQTAESIRPHCILRRADQFKLPLYKNIYG